MPLQNSWPVNPDYNALPQGFGTTSGPDFDKAVFDNGMVLGPYPMAGAGGGGGQQTPGVANIQTSINPRGIYSQQQTNAYKNQAVADASKRGNLNYAMKQFDRPGVSRGAQSIYMAMPKVANAYSDAAMASAAIPLADESANQQNMLRGEIAQGLEFNQLARLLLGQQSLGNWVSQSNLSGMGGLLSGIGALI
jgi:hypothetical protein